MTYHDETGEGADPATNAGYGTHADNGTVVVNPESPVVSRRDSEGSEAYSGQVKMAHSLRQEFKHVLFMAIPIVLTTVFQNLQGTIAIIFCGHLGDKLALDGAALGVSMINVTCLAVGQGMGTACDTFFSQTFGRSTDVDGLYGSRNKKKVGVHLQRGLMVFLQVLTIVFTIHVNLEPILIVLGQDPEVARLAGNYVLVFMPGALCFFCYVVLSKYVLNQNHTIPMVVIGVTSNIVNGLLHYLLIFVFHLGTTGSAISQVAAYFTSLSLTLSYIICTGMYKLTWDGWSFEALRDWGPFIKLSMAGMIMVCVEWWAFEIGVFLSGILGQTELGAQSVVMQLDNIYYQIPLGMQTTCCIRVGQYLGAGDAKGAKRTSWVSISLTGILSLVFAILFTALRMQLPWLFTNVPDVVSLTSGLLPLVAMYTFFDSISGTCKGVLHGSGRQIYGAVILIISYYFVVFPIAAPLMFLTNLKTYGYWWTMAGSLIIQCCIFLGIVFWTNWEFQVEKARRRTGEIKSKPDSEPDETSALLEKPEGRPKRKRILSASLTSTEIRALTESSDDTPRGKLIIRRIITVGVFLTILTTGILVRVFIKVPLPHLSGSSTNCVQSNSTMDFNTTLPICNYTTTEPLISTPTPFSL